MLVWLLKSSGQWIRGRETSIPSKICKLKREMVGSGTGSTPADCYLVLQPLSCSHLHRAPQGGWWPNRSLPTSLYFLACCWNWKLCRFTWENLTPSCTARFLSHKPCQRIHPRSNPKWQQISHHLIWHGLGLFLSWGECLQCNVDGLSWEEDWEKR